MSRAYFSLDGTTLRLHVNGQVLRLMPSEIAPLANCLAMAINALRRIS